MKIEETYKSRSYGACINSAYRVIKDNFKSIIKKTWIVALIYSFVGGAFMMFNIPDKYIHDIGMKNVGITELLFMITIACLFIIYFIFYALICKPLNQEKTSWNIIRSVKINLSFLIISIIVSGILVILLNAFHSPLYKYIANNQYSYIVMAVAVLVLIFLLLLVVGLPLFYSSMKYMMDKDCALLHAIYTGYIKGIRHFGFIFITMFVVGIILGVICLFTITPFIIILLAQITSQFGALEGDELGTPEYFHLLLYVVSVISCFILLYINVMWIYVSFYVYGSIETQDNERKNAAGK